MNINPGTPAVLVPFSFATITIAGEFRRDDEPGYRQSVGNEDTPQTQEQMDFLNCSLRENLRSKFVEACAIFKQSGRRYLECRYYPGTYENVQRAEITNQRENVVNICSAETLIETNSRGTFSDFWSNLFGE